MEKIRNRFVSLNDIYNGGVGYKFFAELYVNPFEVIETSENTVLVARGFLGEKYQKVRTIKFIDQNGKTYIYHNANSNLIGDTIYLVHFQNEDWDKLSFKNYNYVMNERKDNYINYLITCKNENRINQEEFNSSYFLVFFT